MKRFSRILPIYTLVAGIFGAFLYHNLLANISPRGLLPEDHAGQVLLPVILAIAVCALIVYRFSKPRQDFRIAISFPVQGIGALAGAAGCIIWLSMQDGLTSLAKWMLILCAVGFGILSVFRFMGKKPLLAVPALICLTTLVFCFVQYRQWSSYTQLQLYLFPALSTLSLSLYSLMFLKLEIPQKSPVLAFAVHQIALLSHLVCLGTENWLYYLAISVWLISCNFTTPYRMKLPKPVLTCIQALEQAGYTAYAVGGCVRDAMLGFEPHDYDLCTSATPEQICQVFGRHQLILNGEKHGTIGVVLDGQVYEITTYRTEGGYQDSRHPDWVAFVENLDEDLSRRDFTVNAMAYHPQKGYIDPFGGAQDLRNGVLRAVGDPETRFREDALRILRGVRFACRFDLQPEPETAAAMEQLAPLTDHLAKERVLSEMNQILCHLTAQDMERYRPILLQVIPQLQPCVDFQQHSRHHLYDVYTHTAHVVAAVKQEPALRWAALLHDVGKPQVFTEDEAGNGHFYGHAAVSAKIAQEILQQLKAPTELRQQVFFLITHHMDELSPTVPALRKKLSRYGVENLRQLVALQWADRQGTGKPSVRDERRFEKSNKLIDKLEKTEGRLQVTDLAINGHDLMSLGFAAGPALGQCQQQLLELVLNGELPNERDSLLEKATAILQTPPV